MTIEILRFRVRPGRRDEFIQRNEEIWTPALREQPGFIRREVLVTIDEPDEVAILVYWESRADLDAFPADRQRTLEARMSDLIRSHQERVYDTALVG